MARADEHPDSYARHLENNRRPHPKRSPRTIELTCIGTCGGKTFLSHDRRHNRLCPTCACHNEGITGGAAIGGNWRRGKAGA